MLCGKVIVIRTGFLKTLGRFMTWSTLIQQLRLI